MEERVEAALLAALDRLEKGEEVGETWLRDRFPDCAGEVLEILDARERLSRPPFEDLGPYRLLGRLGRGGAGTVYLARATQVVRSILPDTLVAVKLLDPDVLSASTTFERLWREAELGLRIDHPNVVRTLDYALAGDPDAGPSYLVTEYVRGPTLRELLADLGTVPEALLRDIGTAAADGLAAIHGQGMLHCDLKPENVFLAGGTEVKIADFGVAAGLAEEIRTAGPPLFRGTLAYCSPEQLRARPLDDRTDLYSLGLVLFELASGRHPFDDPDRERMVLRRLKGEAPRLRKSGAAVSSFLDEVVANLLCRKKVRRISSARKLACVLREGESSDWWTDRERRARTSSDRPDLLDPVLRRTALYGREDELAFLGDAWARAVAGEGGAVLLVGEPGIGKSRLVEDFRIGLIGAGNGVQVLAGRCDGGMLSALSRALSARLGRDRLEERVAALLSEMPLAVPALVACLRGDSPASTPESANPEIAMSAATEAVRSLSSETPALLLLEDLHLAVKAGAAPIAPLVSGLRRARALVVLTSRPGLPETWWKSIERVPQLVRRDLPPLPEPALSALVRESLGAGPWDPDLDRSIAARAAGNPLFALEIVRDLKTCRDPARHESGETPTAGRASPQIALPETVRAILLDWLADLDESTRRIVDVGACVGTRFAPGLVARVLSQGSTGVLRNLARCERRYGFLCSAGADVSFAHHVVHEIIRDEVPAGVRREYHAAIARVLEEGLDLDLPARPAGRGERRTEILRHHLAAGSALRALPYFEDVLAYLGEQGRATECVDLLSAALRAEEGLPAASRCTLLLGLADALRSLGRTPERRAAIEEAILLAEPCGDAPALAGGWLALGKLHRDCGGLDDADRALGKALDLARETGDRNREATALVQRVYVFIRRGRFAEAEAASRLALQISSEIADLHREHDAHTALGAALRHQGKLEEALRHHRLAGEIAGRIGSLGKATVSDTNIATTLRQMGRFEEALDLARRAVEFRRRSGLRRLLADGLLTMGNCLRSLGREAESLQHYQVCAALDCETGNRVGEAMAIANIGHVHMITGRPEEALANFQRFLDMSRSLGLPEQEGGAYLYLAELNIKTGRLDDARPMLAKGLRIHRRIGNRTEVAIAMGMLGELAMHLGSFARARRHRERALELQGPHLTKGARASRLFYLGQSCLHGGMKRDAADHFRDARAGATEAGDLDVVVVATAALAAAGATETGEAVAAWERRKSDMSPSDRMHAAFYLWMATQDRAFLGEAYSALTELSARQPEAWRGPWMEYIWLHRTIRDAWAATPPPKS